MFGRKKNEAPEPPRRKGADLMSQMGMGQFEAELYGDVENDEELEAELLALQGKPSPKKKAKARGPVSANEFDRMIAESMKDLDEEEVSDTEDPDLLDELQELEGDSAPSSPVTESPASGGGSRTPGSSGSGTSIVAVLEDRLQNYDQASQSAKSAGDMSKHKRIERGKKTIQDLLKKARQGRPVNEDEIPPQVAVTTTTRPQPPPPTQPEPIKPSPVPTFEPTIQSEEPKPSPQPRKPAPAPPPQELSHSASGGHSGPALNSEDSHKRKLLTERRDQYKRAALEAKHGGDIPSATKYVKISKQFDKVISALEAGNPIDLSQMPPPPPGVNASSSHADRAPAPSASRAERQEVQRGGDEASPAVPPPPSEDEEKDLFKAPDAPKTALEALHQRLDKYKNAEQQAKEEGNTSKSRRMGRIAKQYTDAIKMLKAGKPVDFEELPTPPGYAPIPTGPSPAPAERAPAPSPSQRSLQAPAAAANVGQRLPQPAQRSPQPAQRSPQPQKSPAGGPSPNHGHSVQESGHKISQKKKGLKRAGSRCDQQSTFLRERMQEYKTAALHAKKNGDIALAKQYLRLAKGFEPMIDAAESGLPVDLTQLPPPLESEDDNPNIVMVSKEECELSGDREEVFQKLEQDLISQIRTCVANSSHFSKLGDVISANKFQKMESGLRKDLDALKNALRHNDPVPKFHYENKTFSMVQCNTDLGDNDLELTVVRGLQYNPPSGYSEKDLDTYVKYEFPFPTDEPQVGQTETAKGSFNPEYQDTTKMTMNRKSRALVRVIERKTIKLEILYKRGFLKSDKPLGTVNVKLLPLETQCTVHDSYDLTDGRKTVGGKLEVKVRIRDPFKSKQVEEVKEKWLVIDQFIKTMTKPSAKSSATDKKQMAGSTCMEVLKFEKKELDKQISSLRSSLNESQLSALTSKSKLLQDKIDQRQASLKSGGVDAWKEYVGIVEQDIKMYADEGRQYAQHGDMQKAQLMLTKKKLAEKEVTAIRTKIPSI